MTKSEVKKLQQELNAKGANLVVDGIRGPLTKAAEAKYADDDSTSTDKTTDGEPRFADFPGNPEVWKDSTTGDSYVVMMVPGMEPEVPMKWKVDPKLLKAYFGSGKVTYDRTATTAAMEKAGALDFGEADEVVLRGENPFVGWASQFEREKEVLPWLEDPEVAALWASSYLEGRTPSDAELAGTDWFIGKTGGEQKWITLQWSQPETAKQVEASNRVSVKQLLEDSGVIDADEASINYIADKWTQGHWTDVDRNYQISLMSDPYKEGERDAGLINISKDTGYTTTTDQVKFVEDEMKRWLGPVYGNFSKEQIQTWAGRLRNDPNAEDAFQKELSRQRMAVLPQYENTDLTYEDIATPWRNYVSQSWGQNLAEDDNFFQQILATNDAAEAGVMLRDEGLTRGVKQVEDDFVSSVGRSFGGREGVRGFGDI